MKLLLLIGFTCCLAVLSIPAISRATSPSDDGLNVITDGAENAAGFIQAYLDIKSPSHQDMEKLLAKPSVRSNGATIAFAMMVDNLSAVDSDSLASFDPGENVRLFNLVEVLYRTQATPPSNNPEEAAAIKIRVAIEDALLAAGLQVMVETFAIAQDPESAIKYYNRFKELPRQPLPDLSRANAIFSLVHLHCWLDDMSSAVKFYDDFAGLPRDLWISLCQSMAIVSLVEAFTESGQMAEALKFYAELDKLNSIDEDKITAGRALIAGYTTIGDLKAAEEWENRIKVEEEQLWTATKKEREFTSQKHNELFLD